jgi:hypothetical protein
VRQGGYLPELYKDARSEKYKTVQYRHQGGKYIGGEHKSTARSVKNAREWSKNTILLIDIT